MKISRLLAPYFLLAALIFATPTFAANAPTLTMGNPKAPITIDEYASLGCPHCADFTMNTMPDLKKNYVDTGKVKIIFHHFPLERASLDGSLLVGCVPPAQQGDAVNLLYFQQANWAHDPNYDDKLVGLGQMLGLSAQAAKACLNDANKRDVILQGRVDAVKNQKIDGTPTLIFNGGAARLVGFQSYDQVVEVLSKF